MKLLPEVYHSVAEMIEGTIPESRLSPCAYFVVSGHDVHFRIPEYMGEACFCVNAEIHNAFTFTESTGWTLSQ